MSQWIKRIIVKSPWLRVATTLISLCPVFYGGKGYQRGSPFCLPLAKGGWEGFYKVFSNCLSVKKFRIYKFP